MLSSEQKKPKKGLLFVVLAIILILVGAGVAVGMMGRNNVSEDDFKTKFNIYENMLLYNKNSKELVDGFNRYEEYYIDQNYSDKDYIDKVISKYDDFLVAVEKSGTNLFSDAPLSYIKDNLNFLKDSSADEVVFSELLSLKKDTYDISELIRGQENEE